ncbi:MAG: HSP90 family protein [Propioniciclava sp.]|uniref:HSP90 family protein n=1 Tax=Propioniciclava sp. TaxID=2038686 RepID=UPI0039E5EE3D
MSERFQVDLGGLISLLSGHLYSGPQVYLRELLQNAVDAVSARRSLCPDAPAAVRLVVHENGVPERRGVPVLDVIDTGIGLTAAEAVDLLATIGRSSKTDPYLGGGRAGYIGQFGIGLLAAFMVADEVDILSCSASAGATPVSWRGRAEGTFEVAEPPDDAATAIGAGTRVRLWARPDAEHWLSRETVVTLARDYGGLLPIDVAVEVPVEGAGMLPRRVSSPALPWDRAHHTPAHRADALASYCEETFGFTPLGHIDLAVDLVGLSGVAFILPQAVAPGMGGHRVYLKRMLLGDRVTDLLPEWAFFVRVVLNATGLQPTASREQLHADELLLATQEALAVQLKDWARTTLAGDTPLARRFIQVHHLALRALAVADDEMLDLVAAVLPFETTSGLVTLAELARSGEVLYAPTVEEYRRVAAVARAQDIAVVNAGYVYDADLLGRLARRPGWRVRPLAPSDLVHVLALLPPVRELELLDAVTAVRAVLAHDDCGVLIRSFEPDSVPALMLEDRDGAHQRDLRRQRDASANLWSDVLAVFATDQPTRTLVLNDASAVVRDLLACPPGPVFEAGVRSLYLTAVMLAGERLRNRDLTALNDALGTLLRAGVRDDEARDEEAS